jgi:hypothetical protein
VLDEQRVAEHLPQARERGARRGLGHVQPFRGAGDVLLPQQRVQDDQQVEVELPQVHPHRPVASSRGRS